MTCCWRRRRCVTNQRQGLATRGTFAVATTARHLGLRVNDFAVAPIFGDQRSVGHHRFVIETTAEPEGDFAGAIDRSLAEQNADYRTKRINDITISTPKVSYVPDGTFAAWMTANGKAGGQHKVPRVTTPEQLEDITRTSPPTRTNRPGSHGALSAKASGWSPTTPRPSTSSTATGS